MCPYPFKLLKKQKLSDSNLQHTNPVFKLRILYSLHYTHSDKTSKIIAANMFWGYLTLSISPFFKTCLPTPTTEEVG